MKTDAIVDTDFPEISFAGSVGDDEGTVDIEHNIRCEDLEVIRFLLKDAE